MFERAAFSNAIFDENVEILAADSRACSIFCGVAPGSDARCRPCCPYAIAVLTWAGIRTATVSRSVGIVG
jgi:hypothetical protein